MKYAHSALIAALIFSAATVVHAKIPQKLTSKPAASKADDAFEKAVRKQEEQNRRWDAEMRKVTTSICRGC